MTRFHPTAIQSTTGMSLQDYSSYIVRTADAYSCVGFEVLDRKTLPQRFAILRHDIDMSPRQALELAQIEARLGVRTTYTVLLTGTFYSPFEANTREILRNISALGHAIGLHFDASFHDIKSEKELDSAVQWEAEVLSKLLGGLGIEMFSFHNTTPFTMSCRASHYGGLQNAYADLLRRKCEYTSDSNGYWIHRTWNEVLEGGHDRIQILTHPEWWQAQDAEPAEKIACILNDRAMVCWRDYCSLLIENGRVNRTGLDNSLNPYLGTVDRECLELLHLWLRNKRSLAAQGLQNLAIKRHVDLQNWDLAAELTKEGFRNIWCNILFARTDPLDAGRGKK